MVSEKKHAEFIRKLPCCVCLERPSIWAHIRKGSYCGGKRKPHPKRTVPLCNPCHGRQHQIGEVSFWGDLFGKAVALGGGLYEITGDLEKGIDLIVRWKR